MKDSEKLEIKLDQITGAISNLQTAVGEIISGLIMIDAVIKTPQDGGWEDLTWHAEEAGLYLFDSERCLLPDEGDEQK